MDLIGPLLETPRGSKYIVTLTDYFCSDGKVVKKKANVAQLKIYTKRAAEDDMQTSAPSAKKSKVLKCIIL